MRRSAVGLVFSLPMLAALSVFAACSSDSTEAPTPPGTDAQVTSDSSLPPLDARAPVDASVVPDGAPLGPPCTPADIEAGTGTKFCDLPGTDVAALQVPAGFCIREFTSVPVTEARVMRFAPNGDLFVAAPSAFTPGGASGGPGAIVVLPDDNHDGRADSVLTFAGGVTGTGGDCATQEGDPTNLACVHGLAFSDGYLYFTRSDEVRRVPYTAGDRVAQSAAGERVATLGGAAIPDVRWTHTLETTRTGSILVSRGRFDTDTCSAEQMTRGAVFTLHVEGTPAPALPITPTLLGDGFRNPMYLRCSTASCGDCFASELSGDDWDGVGGREKIALLDPKTTSWGYPCCVGPATPGPGGAGQTCLNVSRELTSIALHDTPFGLDFDQGAFPAPYTHGLFVALHGVRTSFGGSGVVWVKTDPVSLRPTGTQTMFVKGFGSPAGRATDVAFAPDGRMFIADDTSGRIYWVAPRTLAAPH